MKKLLLILIMMFALAKGYGQALDTPRYTVYFDKFGIQHTSMVPTKLLAITGNLNDAVVKFTTLSQSGITDVYTKTESNSNFAPLTGSSSYVPVGRIITINGTAFDLSQDRSWTISSSAPVSSVFGRTGAVISATGDYNTTQVTEGTNLYWTTARGDARYPQLTGSYTNPSWLVSIPWSKITSTPTSLAGYGIIDVIPSNILPKSANYTVLTSDFASAKTANLTVKVNCTSGPITITLPSSIAGYSVTVIKTDNTANVCTISGLTAATGDNLLGYQNQSRTAVGDGTNWLNN